MITKTKVAFWIAYTTHLVLVRVCGLWSFDLRSAWGLTGFLLVSLTYAALAAGFAIASRAFDGVIAVRAMQAPLSPGVARAAWQPPLPCTAAARAAVAPPQPRALLRSHPHRHMPPQELTHLLDRLRL